MEEHKHHRGYITETAQSTNTIWVPNPNISTSLQSALGGQTKILQIHNPFNCMGFSKSYINIHITSKYFPHDNKQTLHQYYKENCAKKNYREETADRVNWKIIHFNIHEYLPKKISKCYPLTVE